MMDCHAAMEHALEPKKPIPPTCCFPKRAATIVITMKNILVIIIILGSEQILASPPSGFQGMRQPTTLEFIVHET